MVLELGVVFYLAPMTEPVPELVLDLEIVLTFREDGKVSLG